MNKKYKTIENLVDELKNLKGEIQLNFYHCFSNYFWWDDLSEMKWENLLRRRPFHQDAHVIAMILYKAMLFPENTSEETID